MPDARPDVQPPFLATAAAEELVAAAPAEGTAEEWSRGSSDGSRGSSDGSRGSSGGSGGSRAPGSDGGPDVARSAASVDPQLFRKLGSARWPGSVQGAKKPSSHNRSRRQPVNTMDGAGLAACTPSLENYNAVLKCMLGTSAPNFLCEEAFALLVDMERSNIEPDAETLEGLFMISCFTKSPLRLRQIMDIMLQKQIKLGSWHWSRLLEAYVFRGQHNQAIALYDGLHGSKDVILEHQPIIKVVSDLIKLRDLEEALRLLKLSFWPDLRAWFALLEMSACCGYTEGVKEAWNRLFVLPPKNKNRIEIINGLCIPLLNYAAEHNDKQLLTDILSQVKLAKIQMKHPHFEPVIKLYANTGDHEMVFNVFKIMEQESFPPDTRLLSPLIQKLATDPETAKAAYSSLLSTWKKENKVSVSALNAIMAAFVKLGDFTRAVTIYDEFANFKCSPNIHTFNILIHGCAVNQFFESAASLLKDMQILNISLDHLTYEYMVLLSLEKSTNGLQDAFTWKEKMIQIGIIPSYDLYKKLITHCVEENDDRTSVLANEMESYGYNTPLIRSRTQQVDVSDQPPPLINSIIKNGIPLETDVQGVEFFT